jgi:Restriction endonuclease
MNFDNMTDDEVELSLRTNVASERKILHVILEHIREVDSRGLHLKRAFSSLKEYLISEYGYSGSPADRRIEAAQLMKDVPDIAVKVRDGELNLSQIGEVHYAIKQKERISRVKVTVEEKHVLIESVVGLTTREAQQGLSLILDIPVRKFEKVQVQQDGSVQVTLWLSKDAFASLNDHKDSCAQKLAQQNQEINLSNTMNHILEKKHGDISSNVTETEEAISSSEIIAKKKTDTVPLRVNKTLTPKTRSYVLQRDGCCVFKDHKTGKVCGSKFTLQADHIRSRRLGGDHSTSNLQTLCARHNRFKYQQEKIIEWQFFG